MDISILSLQGEFDLSQRTRLQKAFASLTSAPAVIVNFTKALYIDSTVLGCLIELRRAKLEQKGRLVLAGLNSSVRRIFEVSSLLSIFDTAATIGEAVKSLAPQGAEIEHAILESEGLPSEHLSGDDLQRST